ncbi:MAG: hypothetical protein WCI94_05325 [Rhodospirillales bacterium]
MRDRIALRMRQVEAAETGDPDLDMAAIEVLRCGQPTASAAGERSGGGVCSSGAAEIPAQIAAMRPLAFVDTR